MVNPLRNRVWDSDPILTEAPDRDSEERAMYAIFIAAGLLAGSLANLICLYGYL